MKTISADGVCRRVLRLRAPFNEEGEVGREGREEVICSVSEWKCSVCRKRAPRRVPLMLMREMGGEPRRVRQIMIIST